MLHFDQVNHVYTLRREGQPDLPLPSVTELTRQLVDYAGVSRETLEIAAERGKAVHLACHLYDVNDLDETSIDPIIQPYLQAWIRFRTETGYQPAASEEPLHHPTLLYAGTLDSRGILAGARTLIDRKATAAILPAVRVQTAAYAELVNQKHPGWVQDRRSLQLRPDGSYRLSPAYRDPNDFRTFLALLTVHNWRQRHAA